MATYIEYIARITPAEFQTKLRELMAQGYVIDEWLGQSDWSPNSVGKVSIQYSDPLRIVNVMGISPDLPATAWVDVWAGPTTIIPIPTEPVELEVVSAVAENALGGTGAQAVELQLLDENFDETRVGVNLNGITPVAVPGTWLRINNTTVTAAGATGWTEGGNISVQGVGGGDVYDVIVPERNISNRAFGTVANETYPRIISWQALLTSKNAASEVQFRLQRRISGGVWIDIDQTGPLDENHPIYAYSLGAALLPGDDVKIIGFAAATGESVYVHVTFSSGR